MDAAPVSTMITTATTQWTPRQRWAGHTVRIEVDGAVSLRRRYGRAIAWSAAGVDPDEQARDWLRMYSGATLDDRRLDLLAVPQIGNAVSVRMAKALCGAMLDAGARSA